MSMTNREMSQKQVATLNAAIEKHQELHEFHERLRSLDEMLASTINANEYLRNRVTELTDLLREALIKAKMYELLTKHVQENVVMQGMWDELLITLKLVVDDAEKEFVEAARGPSI